MHVFGAAIMAVELVARAATKTVQNMSEVGCWRHTRTGNCAGTGNTARRWFPDALIQNMKEERRIWDYCGQAELEELWWVFFGLYIWVYLQWDQTIKLNTRGKKGEFRWSICLIHVAGLNPMQLHKWTLITCLSYLRLKKKLAVSKLIDKNKKTNLIIFKQTWPCLTSDSFAWVKLSTKHPRI